MNRALSFLLFIVITNCCLAFNISDYRFHTMPETSYYGGIHSIAKDSIGRIWFSGYDVLYMYDGNTFIQMNELVTKHSISLYWTYGPVFTDRAKRLYVATNHGLLRFNYHTKIFEHILTGGIGTIAADRDGSIWLAHDNKIQLFDPDQLRIKSSFPQPAKLSVSSLISTKDFVYIGTNGKVFRMNKKTLKYTLFAAFKDQANSVVRDIVEYNNSVYILTHMDGLYECDRNGKIVQHYTLLHESGKSTICKKLYIDSSNTIWIATQSGLFLFDPVEKKNHLLRSNLHYAYSLPNNSVWSVYPDPDGGVWVGTYGGKLAYMTFYDNDVNYFRPTPGGLNHPIVSSFEEDRDGNIWIGTEGGGLNYWNRKNDHFSYYTQDNKSGITSNMIKSLHYNKEKNTLQVSAFNGGMLSFDKQSQRFIDLKMYYPATSQQLSIYDFATDRNNGTWLTNPDFDLIYKNPSGTIETVPLRETNGTIVNTHIETLFVDNDNFLWLMTRNGLYKMDINSRRITKYYYIKNAPYSVNNLCSFCITNESDIWFGTRGGGVNRLGKDGSYINFGEKDGLFGKTVFGILEDSASKNLWFSTNDGLYYYDHKLRKIRKFLIGSSKLCGAFYVRSCFKTSSGEMLFGGTNGFIMFTPGKIKLNNQKPKVFFTDLLINNKSIIPGEKNSPLKQDISTFSYTNNNDNKITLSHSQSNIEIRISANSYLDAEKNRYAYRMTGLSDKWYTLPTGQKSVQFFNLPAGKYIFEIKASNNDGLWGNEVSRLYFVIKPSPFFSVWAYIIYTLLLMFAVHFVWRYFTNKKIFKHRLEMEMIKEQNMKKLTQARINFFTNISHDLKTPLTLVIDPLKQLKEFLPENQSANALAYIHIIEKNVNRIQRMISQLLQFREIESQKITLNKQPGDIILYLIDIFSLFELYANKKGIETHITSDPDSFYTNFDHDVIEKIFTNLFSNAIKYTFEKGFIELRINTVTEENLAALGFAKDSESQYISVAVTNTGTEIPDDKKEKIFESFHRLSTDKPSFETSTGLGLAIVKEMVDSINGKIILESGDSKVTFTVILPMTLNIIKSSTNDASYEYTISEINNILAESADLNMQDKRRRKAHSVVIIEDDPDLRSYMEQRLSDYYNVYTAANGAEGIARTEKIFPQVVITDLMMPEADGFEVCRKLRSNIKTSHIAIVVISALGKNTENKIKALENGANVFIDKPFDMEYLLKQVDNLIKNQIELKEAYSKKYVAEPSKVTISSADEELLGKALKYIEQNIGNIDYNVESFVSDMGIGRTLLYQKINDILGMSIKEFIIDIRLKRGAQLLQESELTIAEISDQIGFNNPKYFSICFKKQYNVTPTEFRKKP